MEHDQFMDDSSTVMFGNQSFQGGGHPTVANVGEHNYPLVNVDKKRWKITIIDG